MLGDCGVLSGSEFAAPAFVAATLGDDTPTYVRLPHELLMAAKRADVDDPNDDDDVLCGLAITGDDDGDLVPLPADEHAADLVLVRAPGGPRQPPRRRRRHPLRATRLLFSRNLRFALAALGAALAIGTGTLAYARHIGLFDAWYLAVLTALGAGNPDLGASSLQKTAEMLLVVAGVALIPTVTALVVDVVVNARLALAAGGLTEAITGHIIVVGLGNVGTRVIQELHDFGLDVVAIDRSQHARGVPVAKELDIPVIIANANSAETLRAASVETCRALVVLSTDDVTNLETALLGRAIHRQHVEVAGPAWPGGRAEPERLLRVVLRLFDGEFAERVKHAFDINQSRSVSYLAAPAFAAAMVGREVIDTIPVGRRVLLVAELPVGPGSELEGRFCPEVSRPHEVRLIAVRTRAGLTLWSLPDRRPFVRGDRLLVVATRAGLAALLARTAGVPNPPPLIELHSLPLLTIHPRRPPPDDERLAPDTGTG
jgi:Trk K+ transport system NAD-binding subunit